MAMELRRPFQYQQAAQQWDENNGGLYGRCRAVTGAGNLCSYKAAGPSGLCTIHYKVRMTSAVRGLDANAQVRRMNVDVAGGQVPKWVVFLTDNNLYGSDALQEHLDHVFREWNEESPLFANLATGQLYED